MGIIDQFRQDINIGDDVKIHFFNKAYVGNESHTGAPKVTMPPNVKLANIENLKPMTGQYAGENKKKEYITLSIISDKPDLGSIMINYDTIKGYDRLIPKRNCPDIRL